MYSLRNENKNEATTDKDGDVEMESEADEDSIEQEEEEEEGEDVVSEKDEGVPSLPRAANGKVKTSRGRNERVVAPEECRAHLRRLFYNEVAICALVFGRHGPFAPLSLDHLSFISADMFFLDVIPVSPTRFRPPAKLGDTLFEHPQNELLARVLQTSYRMRDLNINLKGASQKTPEYDESARKNIMAALLERLVQLQIDVNSFMDSSKNPQIVRQGKLPPAGVKQGLEKKEGLFRKHMMVCYDKQALFPYSTLSNLDRASVSTMLHDPSSRQMLTLSRMKLGYPPYLQGS